MRRRSQDTAPAGDTVQPGVSDGPRSVSRRRVFGLVGAGAVGGIAVGGAGGYLGNSVSPSGPTPSAFDGAQTSYPFYGRHQSGIVTPAQDRLHFAAFDLDPGTSRLQLIELLSSWTDAAARMSAGQPIGTGAVTGNASAPPDDTGEALDLPAAALTITVGFGTTLFNDSSGVDRFTLADRRPPQLADLPAFPGDALDPARSGGDLCIQACANDPQIAVHAIRNLARLARGTASVRYSQLGFGRTSATTTTQRTPRNMMGFKDGTANIKAEDHAALDSSVWVQPGDGPSWIVGGTYLVTRRIRMLIEAWDSTPLIEQERVIGRAKGSGAGLGSGTETDPLRLSATDASGQLVIDPHAHVRLAHVSHNRGAALLRRGYSFVDGTDALGRLDAGLFFIAFQRDPRSQFVTIQRSLAGKNNDALNEYIQHVGSGLFACPPAPSPREYWGRALFE